MRPRKTYCGGNDSTEGPTNLLFFDTESRIEKELPFGRGRELGLRLWVAMTARRVGQSYTRQHVYRGKTKEEFWHLVESLLTWKRPLWAFGHNLGYDLTQLEFWSELESKRFTSGPVERGPSPKTGKERPPWRGLLVLEGRPTFLILRHAQGIVRLIDTGNYWPEKLEEIGRRHGLPKLPRPAWSEVDETWYEYCTRDVNVCRVAVQELLRRWIKEDCGVFRMTAASCAMQHFKHTCKVRTKDGKSPNIVVDTRNPARDLEKAAFLGARVEPFYLGTMPGPVFELDANGCYLSAMSGNLFPRSRVRRLWNVSPQKLLDLMGPFAAVADVRIHSRDERDCFPVKRYGLQLHCCGTFWATLCGPELRRALVSGCVTDVGEAHLYSQCELFKWWADYWFERRAEAKRNDDQGEYEFCKLVGNSLSAKFAQRGDRWTDAPGELPRKGWGYSTRITLKKHRVVRFRYIGGHVQKFVTGADHPLTFRAISAYVTAYAREWLRSCLRVCPTRSALYTATDSILCTQPGFDALDRAGLIDPEKMGCFRLEDTHPDAEICGPNWYRLGDTWTCAGLHGRAVKDEQGEPWCEVFDNLPGIISRKPGRTITVRRVKLKTIHPSKKNEDAGDGWRKPLWLGANDEFTDRPSRFVEWPVQRE